VSLVDFRGNKIEINGELRGAGVGLNRRSIVNLLGLAESDTAVLNSGGSVYGLLVSLPTAGILDRISYADLVELRDVSEGTETINELIGIDALGVVSIRFPEGAADFTQKGPYDFTLTRGEKYGDFAVVAVREIPSFDFLPFRKDKYRALPFEKD